MTIGIYKYENKLNGKIYIGLSQDIEKRYQQHLYDSSFRNGGTGIDYAINKYGINNFDFSIIEECAKEELDEREIYWIAYYDSYNNGYNRTIGGRSVRGEDHPRAILTEQEVWNIREMYGKRMQRKNVFQPFLDRGITHRCLKKVWDCETWPYVHNDVYTDENKEWHRHQTGHVEDQLGKSSTIRTIKQEEIDMWLEEKKNGLSVNAIAKKYHRDNGVVEKYLNNPHAINGEVKLSGRTVQNSETGRIFKSISSAAKWAGCGATTLTRHLTSDKIAGKVPETGEPASWIELS